MARMMHKGLHRYPATINNYLVSARKYELYAQQTVEYQIVGLMELKGIKTELTTLNNILHSRAFCMMSRPQSLCKDKSNGVQGETPPLRTFNQLSCAKRMLRSVSDIYIYVFGFMIRDILLL